MERLQNGAVGAVIQMTIEEVDEDGVSAVVNLSSVTQKDLVFRKPSGAVVTKASSFTTDGTDGKIQYVTESDFIDEPGMWQIQADLIFPGSGYDGTAEVGYFKVLENLS